MIKKLYIDRTTFKDLNKHLSIFHETKRLHEIYVLLTDSRMIEVRASCMQGILSFNLSFFLRSVEIMKMISDSTEEELLTKQGGGTNVDKFPVSSRLWSALKNPRIVRVSRTFGGKDRHSKVRTIRGLRDRRVRLSVPTAVQLYDLQDKLGVKQPSKVVDWLLTAAQHEIDKLPPLQMPPGNFIQFPDQSMAISHKLAPPQAPSFHPTGDGTEFIHDDRAFQLASSSSVANGEMLDNNTVQNPMMVQKSIFWNSDVLMTNKEKEAMKEPSIEKGSMIKGLQNNDMSYPSYHHWDPSNAHVSYLGNHSSQADGFHNYQPASMFASYMNAPSDFINAKQYKHLHMDNSASQLLPSNSLRTSLQSGNPSLELLHPSLAFRHRRPQDHQD